MAGELRPTPTQLVHKPTLTSRVDRPDRARGQSNLGPNQ